MDTRLFCSNVSYKTFTELRIITYDRLKFCQVTEAARSLSHPQGVSQTRVFPNTMGSSAEKVG